MAGLSANRNQVLSMFKQLLRTRQVVFAGDENALLVVRNKIRDEFYKHKTEADPIKISELMKMANESDQLLRTKVIQAQEVRPNVYRIRKDHLENICTNAKRERCADCTCGA